MSDPNQASIICKHVMQDFANAYYVAHQSGSWGAGCSKECLDASGPANLSMVCLACFLDIPGLPRDFHTLPSGFAYRRNGDGWTLDYDLDDFAPEEGEFIAAPEDHPVRRFRPKDAVFTLVLPDRSYAVVTLEEGTRCVPFWWGASLPPGIQKALDGSEQLMAVKYSEVETFARKHGIHFLAPDFLCLTYDLAILVSDEASSQG